MPKAMNIIPPRNPFQGVIDVMREANMTSTKNVSEEKCYSCGEYKPMSWDNYRSWRDNWGHDDHGFFCDECLAKRRDELVL